MYYVLRNREHSLWVETHDGRVAKASDSLAWSVGKKIAEVIRWAEVKGLHVYGAQSDAAPIVKIA